MEIKKKSVPSFKRLMLVRCFWKPILLNKAAFIYNPKSEKVGTVWKTQIKKESSDF